MRVADRHPVRCQQGAHEPILPVELLLLRGDLEQRQFAGRIVEIRTHASAGVQGIPDSPIIRPLERPRVEEARERNTVAL
ncbi:hypothetical protein D3C73_1014870 [compost metagenome]